MCGWPRKSIESNFVPAESVAKLVFAGAEIFLRSLLCSHMLSRKCLNGETDWNGRKSFVFSLN